MAFIMPSLTQDLPALAAAGGLHLRTPQLSHYEAWAEVRGASRAQLVPFEPLWAEDELTRTAFRERVRRYHREIRSGLGYPFFIFRDRDDALIGGMSIANVRHGITQSCVVGYWIGTPHLRQGHASAALATICNFAFGQLGLNRVEAACMPRNQASIGVLERQGFEREGLARKYLRIAGHWEDHLLYARLEADWTADRHRISSATAASQASRARAERTIA